LKKGFGLIFARAFLYLFGPGGQKRRAKPSYAEEAL